MRVGIVLCLLAFAGCASAPPPPAPAPSTTTYVTPSGRTVTQIKDQNMDAKRLADAKKLGFRVINENGQTLYCRTQVSTGSRVVRDSDTQCQTPEQWEAYRVAQEQAMSQWRTNAPKSGN